jgi:hypothetical protein
MFGVNLWPLSAQYRIFHNPSKNVTVTTEAETTTYLGAMELA